MSSGDIVRKSFAPEHEALWARLNELSRDLPVDGCKARRLAPGSPLGLDGHRIGNDTIVMAAPHNGAANMVNCATMLMDQVVGLVIDLSADARARGALVGRYASPSLDVVHFKAEPAKLPPELPSSVFPTTLCIQTTGVGKTRRKATLSQLRLPGLSAADIDAATLHQLASYCMLQRERHPDRTIVVMCNDGRGVSARLAAAEMLLNLRNRGVLLPEVVPEALLDIARNLRVQRGRGTLSADDLAVLLEMGRDIAKRQPNKPLTKSRPAPPVPVPRTQLPAASTAATPSAAPVLQKVPPKRPGTAPKRVIRPNPSPQHQLPAAASNAPAAKAAADSPHWNARMQGLSDSPPRSRRARNWVLVNPSHLIARITQASSTFVFTPQTSRLDGAKPPQA
ncbi:hypothetical protein [Roseateles aquatilis]|uniref:hypothetical protein n=1 Tax=Roseateles aquatilis TaxID=431061 RepID=UPI0011302E21|nr:hypothetical protein [Roseateles aquatilis]